MPSDPESSPSGRTGSLPKKRLLAKTWQYKQVYAEGRRLRSPAGISVIRRANGGSESRLGISVHGVSLAVRRNRIKRLIRDFFRLNPGLFSPPADLVFAIRPDFACDSLREVDLVVRALIARRG